MNSIFDYLRWYNNLAVFIVHQFYLVLKEHVEIIPYHFMILLLSLIFYNIFGIYYFWKILKLYHIITRKKAKKNEFCGYNSISEHIRWYNNLAVFRVHQFYLV